MGLRRPRAGVVVGKFNPPHLGHLHLIEHGARRVEHLYVIVGDHPDQTIPAASRAAWLGDAAPGNVTMIVTPDDLPAANEPWARRALEILPVAPDLTFTSEPWGDGWAASMGATHEEVDLDRRRFPISGTQVRADLRTNFHWLVPAARAELARRAVVIGAESTGKTTITEALARELGTVWVPEHGRTYWEGRRHLDDQRWTSDELRRVARAQRNHEDDLARRAVGGVVVADTDALVTAVWHERYLGAPDDELDALAGASVPDLYLVCGPEIPWVQDGTRESADQRGAMHRSMLDRARRSGAEVVELVGTHEARLATGLAAIDRLTDFGVLA